MKTKTKAYHNRFVAALLLVIALLPAAVLAEETPTESPSAETAVQNDIVPDEPGQTNAEAVSTPTVTEETASSTAAMEEEKIPPAETMASSTEAVAKEPLSTADTSASSTVTLHIRYQDQVVFAGPVPRSVATATITDAGGTQRPVAAESVLGILSAADAVSDDFSLEKLVYYEQFGSFMVECLALSSGSACSNWQYVVNDSYPYVGVDQYRLAENDEVFFYFGVPRRVILSTSTAALGESVTATAESYDYRSNTYAPLAGVTLGATQPDPANPWSPLLIASSSVNSAGQSLFTLTATGTYNIGIAEDYYYPTVPLTIFALVADDTPAAPPIRANESGSSGDGASSVPAVHASVDTEAAFAFLRSHQDTQTGAFGASPFYTDWTAIAFGAGGQADEAKTKLAQYLRTDPDSGNLTTDYERRAMALMSLGINPYSGTATNYIDKITASFTDSQFGDAGLVNDDIFALFPLLRAGYAPGDEIIKKTVQFILSKQDTQGGWGSPDMTAAGIQALTAVTDLPGVVPAIERAKQHLKAAQTSSGRIGDNSFATSWALQAMAALNESESVWTTNGKTPGDYLASVQESDGGLESAATPLNDRVWATAYAITGTLKKTWYNVLANFSKPEMPATDHAANSEADSGAAPPAAAPFVSGLPPVAVSELALPALNADAPPTTAVETIFPIAAPTEKDMPKTEEPEPISPPDQTAAQTAPAVAVNRLPRTETAAAFAGVQNQPEPAPAALPATDSSQAIEANSGLTPLQKAAPGVFGGAITLASGLGAYLAWRFLLGLI